MVFKFDRRLSNGAAGQSQILNSCYPIFLWVGLFAQRAAIFGGQTELYNLTAVQELVKRLGHLEQGNRVKGLDDVHRGYIAPRVDRSTTLIVQVVAHLIRPIPVGLVISNKIR